MTRYLIAAAVLMMGIGMIFVYAGVISNGKIIPGAAMTAIGIALAAVGGIASVLRRDAGTSETAADRMDA